MKFSTLIVAAFINAVPSYGLVASNHSLPNVVNRASPGGDSNSGSNIMFKSENKTLSLNGPLDMNLSEEQIIESRMAIEALVKLLGELALTAGDQQVVHGETIPGFSFSMTLLRIMEHLMSIDWHAVIRGEVDWMSHFEEIHRHFRDHHMHFPEEIKRLILLLERILVPPRRHDFERPHPGVKPPAVEVAKPVPEFTRPEPEAVHPEPEVASPELEASLPAPESAPGTGPEAVPEAAPEVATESEPVPAPAPVLMPVEEEVVSEEDILAEGAEEAVVEEEANTVAPPLVEGNA